MKVLVCGGRKYYDMWQLEIVLDDLHAEQPISLLIHGDADGADALAKDWAHTNRIDCLSMPAKWDKYLKAAGPIRNKAMLQHQPDLVVAFPGGEGTKNMIKQARAAGVPVREIEE